MQTFMQSAHTVTPGTAADTGADAVGADDAQRVSGEGIGLETDQPITRDHAQSPAGATNPYLNKNRVGSGPPASTSQLPIGTPGGA